MLLITARGAALAAMDYFLKGLDETQTSGLEYFWDGTDTPVASVLTQQPRLTEPAEFPNQYESDNDSLSSAGAERKRSIIRRSKKTRVENASPPAPLPDGVQLPCQPGADTAVQVASFAELLLQYPQLAQTNANMDDPVAPPHLDEGKESRPWEDRFLASLVQSFPWPRFYAEITDRALSHDEIITELLRGRLHLPLLTTDFERELMKQSGTFVHANGRSYDFPACMHGRKCVGVTENLHGMPPGGCVLTMLLYPDEYSVFLDKNVAPRLSRPCILCCRSALTTFVYFVRANCKTFKVDERCVFMLYRNMYDREGGYYKEYVFVPRVASYEGLVDPIAQFRHSALYARRDPQGRIEVLQTPMEYVPPGPHTPMAICTPTAGETVQSF